MEILLRLFHFQKIARTIHDLTISGALADLNSETNRSKTFRGQIANQLNY